MSQIEKQLLADHFGRLSSQNYHLAWLFATKPLRRATSVAEWKTRGYGSLWKLEYEAIDAVELIKISVC
jgi:hypothetical protein